MAHLLKLAHALEAFPSLQESFNANDILLFVDLCCHLRSELDLTPNNDRSLPPLHLPTNLQSFLALCVFSTDKKLAIQAINDAWKALSRIIWESANRVSPPSALPLFLKYGPELGICESSVHN
jgi:hypothetical protein